MDATTLGRRAFLGTMLASGPALVMARLPRGLSGSATVPVRVASNQGIENAALQQMLADLGLVRQFGLDLSMVESRSISGPTEALLAGEADVCMISGFVGVLPAIEQGKELRLIGAAMERPALALYAGAPGIERVADLAGRTVGIGGEKGLLHILTLALLARKKVDAAGIRFVNCGSNAQVFQAVASGKVDAGLSGIAGMSALGAGKVRVVRDGLLWNELPDYTYQPAYASVRALRDRPDAVARCLAAYTRLYATLQSGRSEAAYLAARRRAASTLGLGGKAGGGADGEGAEIWRFVNRVRPYAVRPGLTPAQVATLQRLNVAVGLQTRVLPYEAVADPRPAMEARRLLG
jgi:NitT/TauT family transport system substrate-binding protein